MRSYRRIVLILAMAGMAVHAATAEQLADSSADWRGGSVQPQGQWEFGHYTSGDTYTTFLRNADYIGYGDWVGGTGHQWDRPGFYPRVGQYALAPHSSYRGVRRWTSNVAGDITIHFDFKSIQSGGKSVSIRKNGVSLWNDTLAGGAGEHHMGAVVSTVVAGDVIDCVINADGSQSADWTHCHVRIDRGNTSPDASQVVRYALDEDTDYPRGSPAGGTYDRRMVAGDASGKDNHATMVNMDGATDWVAGKSTRALDFDGSGDHLLTDTTSIGNGATELTMAAWIRPRAIDHWDGILTTQSTAAQNLFTGMALTDYGIAFAPHARIMNQGGLNGASQIPLNAWTHVLVTWKQAETWRIYINGVLDRDGDGTAPTATMTIDQPWYVGTDRLIAPGRYFNGLIDDVRVYTRVSDPGEVARLYAEGQNGAWPMSDPISIDFTTAGGGGAVGEADNTQGLVLSGHAGVWPQVFVDDTVSPTVTVGTAVLTLDTGGVGYRTVNTDGDGDLRGDGVSFENGDAVTTMDWQVEGLLAGEPYDIILFGRGAAEQGDFTITGHDGGAFLALDAENDANAAAVITDGSGAISGTFALKGGNAESVWTGIQLRYAGSNGSVINFK